MLVGLPLRTKIHHIVEDAHHMSYKGDTQYTFCGKSPNWYRFLYSYSVEEVRTHKNEICKSCYRSFERRGIALSRIAAHNERNAGRNDVIQG